MKIITAIILTFNEEQHIERCIMSLRDFVSEIIVIDSFSTDKTCEISSNLGAKVFQHKFINQAQQFNWALDNIEIDTEWIWRIDADEYAENSLTTKLQELFTKGISQEINGIYVNKKIVFMGKPLLHGGWYPAQQIKLIRKGFGASENKWMDEHLIIFSGETISLDGDQTDENLNNLTWWTQKHNGYSTREAVNTLMIELGMDNADKEVKPKLFGNGAERKRWLKLKYVRMPLFIRPFLNFSYRYFFKLGFLDGKQGFIWHILQGFWYRMLVDAKIYEIRRDLNWDKEKIKEYITKTYLS